MLGGRAADLFGRRRMFIVGLTLFSLASLAGGFADSAGWLIAARGVQGLGAAIVSPAALSIVTTTFTEGAERNKALGIWGALAGAGGAVGVLMGGMLTQWAGWEWVLFVNVPIGAAAALAAPRFVRESRTHERTSMDVLGAVTVTAGLVALVYALVDANRAGWGSFQTIGLLALSVVLLVSFVIVELRTQAPDHAADDLPQPQRRERGRGRAAGRRIALQRVLLHQPLPPAGARLRRAEGRALLPAARVRDHLLGRRRLAADHARRAASRCS